MKEELKKREASQIHAENSSPLHCFGFGITNYQRFLKIMAIVFTVLSLVNLPIMMVYNNGKGISKEIGNAYGGFTSLANLGYSSVQC